MDSLVIDQILRGYQRARVDPESRELFMFVQHVVAPLRAQEGDGGLSGIGGIVGRKDTGEEACLISGMFKSNGKGFLDRDELTHVLHALTRKPLRHRREGEDKDAVDFLGERCGGFVHGGGCCTAHAYPVPHNLLPGQ